MGERPPGPVRGPAKAAGLQASSLSLRDLATSGDDYSAAPDSARALRNKLSSSSLSMSLPPDSPPDTHDYPNGLFDQHGANGDSSTAPWKSISDGRQPRTRASNDYSSPLSSRSRTRVGEPSIASTTSCLASAGTRSTPAIAQRPSSRTDACAELDDQAARRERFTASLGATQTDVKASSVQMSRGELEQLFLNADSLIRAKDQELTLFTTAGEGLKQEYHSVRGRHQSLLSRSPSAELADKRPSASSIFTDSSNSPTRARVPPTAADTPFRSPRPPRESLSGWGDMPDRITSIQTPTSPTTPLRFSSATSRRHFLSSSSSSSSLFAPSPRVGLSSPLPHELQSLSQANYSLTVKLSELEADSERAEKEGKRKLRKLERELAALKRELEHVEARNVDLEAATTAPVTSPRRQDSLPLDFDFAAVSRRRRRSRSQFDEDGISSEDTTATLTNFAPARPADATPASPRVSAATGHLHRSPGNGTPRSLAEEAENVMAGTSAASKAAKSEYTAPKTTTPSTPSQQQLISQLMVKIEELQEANTVISEERAELDGRLERATREMDEFKRRCEELEEVAAISWEDRRGIEWQQDAEAPASEVELSPTRLKGNRRAIRRNQRRAESISMSASRHSLASIASWRDSGSPIPGELPRTLGSELGSHWADSSFERELNRHGEEGSSDGESARTRHDTKQAEKDDGAEYESPESTLGTNSTSTPTRHRGGLLFSDDASTELSPAKTTSLLAEFDLDTTADVIPAGALRYSGPPDSETYEQLAAAASELPAVWESEEELELGQVRGRGLHSGKVADSVLRRLEWREPGGFEGEDYWSKYPEEDEEDAGEPMLMLESKSMVAERERRRPEGGNRRRRRRTRAERGSDDHSLSYVGHGQEDSPTSRRKGALARLGLHDPHDYASEDEDDRVVEGSRYTGSRRYGHRGEDDWTESSAAAHSDYSGDESSQMSDFSYLSHNPADARRKVAHGDNTFYPLTRRARYAPRMLANRFTDSAMLHLFNIVTYFRFFAVLGIAIAYAVWQGPKKTMGMEAPRRRLH